MTETTMTVLIDGNYNNDIDEDDDNDKINNNNRIRKSNSIMKKMLIISVSGRTYGPLRTTSKQDKMKHGINIEKTPIIRYSK